jgi:hypothetical protein
MAYMRIKPTHKDLKNWIKCVPTDGDLIFLSKKHLSNRRVPYTVLSTKQAIDRGLWTLN